MDYKTYIDEYVVINGRSAVCLLCPSTVSGKEMMTEDTAVLISHFQQNHVMKPGFHYCGVCFKSVAPLTQPEQVKIHEEHTRHIVKAERVGKKYLYCADCMTVGPAPVHNPNHQRVEVKYLGIKNVDCRGSGGSPVGDMSKEQIATVFCAMMTVKNGDLIQARALCNEHFEKAFHNGMGKDPLGIQIGVTAKCVACKKLNTVWPQIPVRMGKVLQIPECVLRKYVVGFFAAGVNDNFRLKSAVSAREYADLDEKEQDMYDFCPRSREFILRSGVKKTLTEEFMRKGFAPHVNTALGEDDTDGGNVENDEDDILN